MAASALEHSVRTSSSGLPKWLGPSSAPSARGGKGEGAGWAGYDANMCSAGPSGPLAPLGVVGSTDALPGVVRGEAGQGAERKAAGVTTTASVNAGSAPCPAQDNKSVTQPPAER
jgi:hypothetical protein